MAKDKKENISGKGGAAHFLLVAIGAATGGLDAMTELLHCLPANTGLVYLYLQSSDAPAEQEIVATLSGATAMPVQEAQQGLEIQADHVYVIPAGKQVSLSGNLFKLVTPREKGAAAMPVNRFFTQLASEHQETIAGVLLSDHTDDGVQGIQAIKAAGGITFALDGSAAFRRMPGNVAAEGDVDRVLPVPEIAKELEKMGRQKNMYATAVQQLNEEVIHDGDKDLAGILQLLYKFTGLDFSQYKMSTIKRRIIRRMMLFRLGSLQDYLSYIQDNRNEVNLLYQDLLINVTTFFRDAEVARYLKKTLLPRILRSKGPNEPVRVWVPACSTGQETYSLAMLLMEALDDEAAGIPVQIFSTDISEAAINKARLGIYSRSEVQDVPPRRLQRYFVKMDGHYRIAKSIRDLCIFATHNVLKDPPFSRLDLVSCCNLLIYLDNSLQKKIIATFHYALHNDGYLVLGRSETVGASSHLFAQHDKKLKVYAKKKEGALKAMFERTQRPGGDKGDALGKRAAEKAWLDETDLEKAADALLLKRYTPASVVVNQDLDILQFRGATGPYLEPSPGKASLNLLKMARPGLGFELRNIVHKARRSGEAERRSGLELNLQGQVRRVTIEAIPIRSGSGEPYFLVTFAEMELPAREMQLVSARDKRVKQLEAELNALREDMRSIMEAQEAANEELQSANEEIVSSNEELQSINEELETSKEEIESSNEELITINQELLVRNEQLAEVQEYAVAVFSTIRECLLILDSALCVKAASKAFYKTFRTREDQVEGRRIYELNNRRWNIPQLHTLITQIQEEDAHLEGMEITHYFPGIGEKVLLLNARRVVQKIHGEELILLAIEDITEHRQAQRVLAKREAWLRDLADNAPVMIWVAGEEKQYSFCNKAWLEFRGVAPEDAIGKKWTVGMYPEDVPACEQAFDNAYAGKQPFTAEYRLLHNDGRYRWILTRARPAFTPKGVFSGYIGTCVDIHDQRMVNQELEKRVEQRTHALRETNMELQRSNSELEQFAYVASHDLQEPMRKILTFIDRMQKGNPDALPAETKKYFAKINDASNRMIHLIDDLLNFSRISRVGKRYVKTDLNHIIQGVLNDLELAVAEKQARITVEPLPVIQAIPLQMTQLFHNLLSNALKFSFPGKAPVITVSSRLLSKEEQANAAVESAPPCYDITVRDNGIGFRQEYAEQIFTIFQRLHDRSEYPGTGIGLSLCRKIVNNHNGRIHASSTQGEGAVFHILLPLAQQG